MPTTAVLMIEVSAFRLSFTTTGGTEFRSIQMVHGLTSQEVPGITSCMVDGLTSIVPHENQSTTIGADITRTGTLMGMIKVMENGDDLFLLFKTDIEMKHLTSRRSLSGRLHCHQ